MIVGAAPLVQPGPNADLETILTWADRYRTLGVRANADTPVDAERARAFGAEGIGLCRTEHMFFGEERLPVVQEMILAEDEPARRAALDRLLPFQQADFEAMFEAMRGLPVTIRLLDPPLHEFLPGEDEATSDEDARAHPGAARGEPDARARAAAGSASSGPRSTRCRFVRSRVPPRGCRADGRAAGRRDHAPAGRLRRGAAPAARAHRARDGARRHPGSTTSAAR